MCNAFLHKDRPRDVYVFLENDTNTHGYNNWFFFRTRLSLSIYNLITKKETENQENRHFQDRAKLRATKRKEQLSYSNNTYNNSTHPVLYLRNKNNTL